LVANKSLIKRNSRNSYKYFDYELAKCSSFISLWAGIGQNIAMHALSTAGNFFLVLISTFPVHSPPFFPKYSPYFLNVLVLANVAFHVGSQNKRHQRLLSRFLWLVPMEYNRCQNMCCWVLAEK